MARGVVGDAIACETGALASFAQRGSKLARRLKPVLRTLLQQAIDDGGQGRADAARANLDHGNRIPYVLERDGYRRLAGIRQLAGEHLIDYDPQAVQVGGLVELVLLRLFR